MARIAPAHRAHRNLWLNQPLCVGANRFVFEDLRHQDILMAVSLRILKTRPEEEVLVLDDLHLSVTTRTEEESPALFPGHAFTEHRVFRFANTPRLRPDVPVVVTVHVERAFGDPYRDVPGPTLRQHHACVCIWLLSCEVGEQDE